MAERDPRFGGNLETANIRPREYQPRDRGIANVSNVDDRSLFQRGSDVGKNIYERVDPFIPEVRDDMLNWNVNTDYGRFGVGVGRRKGMLNWTLPFNTSALDTGIGGTDEYQMAELTDKQKEWMRSIGATPDFISPDYSYKHVQGMENKPWDFQWGVQEPTTREEFDEYYNYLLANPSLTSWQT